MNRLGLGLLAVGCVVAMGCGDEVAPLGSGSVALSWEVSPRGCAGAEVTQVEVTLRGGGREHVEVYGCDEGKAYLDAVEPGNYRLELSGLDRTGRETFVSEARTVTVRPDVVNTVDFVRLTAKPAELTVEWLFDNGKVCGANGVEQVELAVFDELDFEIARTRLACNDGIARFGDLSAGAYLVVANGLSRNGAGFRGEADVELKRGDQGHVEVVLAR